MMNSATFTADILQQLVSYIYAPI